VSAGTDPLDADTDDDGLERRLEGALAADPLTFDTDGDGLGDGLEAGRDQPVPAGVSDGLGLPTRAPTARSWVTPTRPPPPTRARPTATATCSTTASRTRTGDGAVQNTVGGTGSPGSGETDPRTTDSDFDGLDDGAEVLVRTPTRSTPTPTTAAWPTAAR
jgi:hypothetical protein